MGMPCPPVKKTKVVMNSRRKRLSQKKKYKKIQNSVQYVKTKCYMHGSNFAFIKFACVHGLLN